ncbi:DNA repair protein RadC [Lachnospiraceae bacterium PF1-22]|uniref:JAB domain-containing protein n=1 Tax=Ohessyouella blattaphilus TaxID=2949333 RepID=UPI003E2A9E5D
MKEGIPKVHVQLIKEKSFYSEERINDPQTAINFIAKELALYDREVLLVLNLSTKLQVINVNVASMGTISAAVISPREIFKASILSNAANIIIAHCHPSGDCTPSEEDIRVTNRLNESGKLIDIPLLDHVIVGGLTESRFSFREAGLLN